MAQELINLPTRPIAPETALVELRRVSRFYPQREGRITVLEDVDMEVQPREFVTLLGPSGSGKSSLVRIICGLLDPSGGEVLYRGRPLKGVNGNVGVVFQSFALYPWLTVLENVELGLRARQTRSADRRQRALRWIDLVGLDGFEEAYPRELSGGMRQRVGVARALALEPELLCMDEPFSGLDVLSAENLRGELLDLWQERKMPTEAIFLVTHSIEEAVLMADRILILDQGPGRIVANLRVNLEHPRDWRDPRVSSAIDDIYKILTRVKLEALPTGEEAFTLPHVSPPVLEGLLEEVADRGGAEDLYRLGDDLYMEVDDLLPVARAMDMLGLAQLKEGDLVLTELGQEYAEAEPDRRKAIFRERAGQLPTIRMIYENLLADENHTGNEEVFLQLLERDFTPKESHRQLMSAIMWARFAELFTYNRDSGELYIEEPE